MNLTEFLLYRYNNRILFVSVHLQNSIWKERIEIHLVKITVGHEEEKKRRLFWIPNKCHYLFFFSLTSILIMSSPFHFFSFFYILMCHIEDTNISFVSDLFFFSVNKYHHHRCIWSDAKITWAKQSEKKKKDHLPKERKMLLLWIDDTTLGRMYVRDYKSNENTIYSKRSKSVWLIKMRREEKESTR